MAMLLFINYFVQVYLKRYNISKSKAYDCIGIYAGNGSKKDEIIVNMICIKGGKGMFKKDKLIAYLYTGMGVGEITGLRWCDIDLEEGLITVDHTLVYYNHGNDKGCYFNVHQTKTRTGTRVIPTLPVVKEAFLMEKNSLLEWLRLVLI